MLGDGPRRERDDVSRGPAGSPCHDEKVTIEIDTSRSLRTYDQLVALVRAVASAGIEDESRSLEWKSGYPNLGDVESSFAISRAILGLANRPVDVAQTQFEGTGYVLVGVEPGRIGGQQVPDSADLLNALRRYTGHGRPLWDPRTVNVDGVSVLVVTVEPPRPGDRIALLHKSFQGAKGSLVAEGTVFVRQPGATERASRADMEMLQDRLLSGMELDVAAARAETRNAELRDLVADMVHAAEQWASMLQILVTMSAKQGWRKSDLAEWVDTDSGRAMAGHAKLIEQNARKVRLRTTNPAMLAALGAAMEYFEAGSAAFAPLHTNRASTLDERGVAYGHLNRVVTAFAALESAATEALSGP